MAATTRVSPPAVRARDLSIDYLRTTLTLMVIAHHSSLAYTTFARFNKQHMFQSTAPVVDSARWLFFDYAENFNDVFFMSLMFFVSGLFVYPALCRHGTWGFIRERLLRLGVPFVFAVVFLMPVAYYAAWQLTGRSTGFIDFYKRLALGPLRRRTRMVHLGATRLRRGASPAPDPLSTFDTHRRALHDEVEKPSLRGVRGHLLYRGAGLPASAGALRIRSLDRLFHLPLFISDRPHRPLRSVVPLRLHGRNAGHRPRLALSRRSLGAPLPSLDVGLHSRL
jgi:hypothetical protein